MGRAMWIFPAVFLYAGLMVGFYLLASLLTLYFEPSNDSPEPKVVFQMRKDVFDRLAELPVSFFDRTQTGDIVSRISYDIDTVNASLSMICCKSAPA